MEKILFFKIGAMGDVLMSTPLVRAVRKAKPEAHIYYATGTWSAKVLKGNNNIDKILEFNETQLYKKNIWAALKLIKKIRKERFDILFVLDKTWMASVLGKMTGIKTRIGFNRNNEGFGNTKNIEYKERKHEIEYYLELGTLLEISSDGKQMDLTITEQEKENANRKLKGINNNIIVIAPGGAENPGQKMPSRRWKNYKTVAKSLKAQGNEIILIGGKGDNRFGFGNTINLIGKTTIGESAAIMQKAQLVICNDSGTMHIASAAGAKTLSIFGPTDPKRKAPIGSKYLWHEINLDNAELHGRYTKEQKDNIFKVKAENVIQTALQMLGEKK